MEIEKISPVEPVCSAEAILLEALIRVMTVDVSRKRKIALVRFVHDFLYSRIKAPPLRSTRQSRGEWERALRMWQDMALRIAK